MADSFSINGPSAFQSVLASSPEHSSIHESGEPPGVVAANSAAPVASIPAVVACSRVDPESAIGPVGMLIEWIRGLSSTTLDRSVVALRISAGLQNRK